MSVPACGAPAVPARMAPRAAFALVVALVITFLAASSAPSPLYAMYREAWGFSALLLTVVFSSYAFALLGALLVFGALSDHLGRRAVILAGLVLEIGAIVLFWRADSVGWLIAARVLQGIATGMATSVLSATLLDLNPARGALFNSLSPMIGMAVGALGASALVQFAPQPMHLVYEVLLVALVLQAILALRLPETVTPRPGAWASMVPRAHVPPAARALVLRLMPLNTAGWALGGFYLSLGPTLARLVTGRATPLAGGLLIATLVLMGAAAMYVVRQRPARRVLRASAALLAVGLAITLLGVHAQQAVLFFGGTVVAGMGFGASFNAAVRSLVPAATPHQRAGLMSSFFVLSYLAFSVPAILAGLAVGGFGLQATTLGYGLVLVALALLAWVGARERA
ncbi:putative MFS family arabinose efflux permease [Pseudacidovorax intermedius]|uniref:Putative MFS family arabinose efflux permease n=1 Tax=Pseudacidovorax intermedius TaxID=433924 RepID=A0A370FLP9_9BURK|nr:MFS transporter [Pseudacidovorax intermedius]RDI28607.1 putative MFS family arabinose efflux permease [Pseudacidovorax intermedius]